MKNVNDYTLDELRETYRARTKTLRRLLNDFPFRPDSEDRYESISIASYTDGITGVKFYKQGDTFTLEVALPEYDRKSTNSNLLRYITDGGLARSLWGRYDSRDPKIKNWHPWLKQAYHTRSIPSCSLHNEGELMLQMLHADYLGALEAHKEYGIVEKKLNESIDTLCKQRADLYEKVFGNTNWPDYSNPFMRPA